MTRWFLPLSVLWDDEPPIALPNQLALARVRRGRRTGLLTDALAHCPEHELKVPASPAQH